MDLSLIELLLLVLGVPFAIFCYYFELKVLFATTMRLKNEQMLASQYSPEDITKAMMGLKKRKLKGNKEKDEENDVSYGSMYQ